jgi:hypothetical protein
MTACPSCGKSIAKDALRCIHCGAEFGQGSSWKPVDLDVELEPKIATASLDQKDVSWFRRIILIGLALPGLAELGCDMYLSARGERILGFGVAYVIPSWGPFAFNPLISNVGAFLLYAGLAPLLFLVRFKRQHLAQRLVLGGLVGMASAVFLMAWLLISDLHHVGQGYFFYMIVFPMILLGMAGALVGMAAGLLFDRVLSLAGRS